MHAQTLNLGILAHVDAGKTTLTERLLYTAGVIDELGSVDAGSTQTDTLALERERGITIRAAVASFAVGDATVNLIDTPGHPDFIAEVERSLSVLDTAVLVVSAVEGVQPQTRILMRALQRLHVPTLIFVNKIDRPGASPERVFGQLAPKLRIAAIAMGAVRHAGSREAVIALRREDDPDFVTHAVDILGEHDDVLLRAYVDDEATVSAVDVRRSLIEQTKNAVVHPVFFGSALTGAGVEEFMRALTELLPADPGDADAPVSAAVFKVARDGAERVAYARVFAGTIGVRDRVHLRRPGSADIEEMKVTAVASFVGADAVRADAVTAGQIGKLWGLDRVQIGDVIGASPARSRIRVPFAPPTLESVVQPRRPGDERALYLALSQLAEQDPLIAVRRDEASELSVSLYGEVQKEVIQATLARDFGLEVDFGDATVIHVERPVRAGEALEELNTDSNPFRATIGLRVEPSREEGGIEFSLRVDPKTTPLYVYKTFESFGEHMEMYVRDALREGLFGWQVTDCIVTLTQCAYSVPDGPPSRRGPLSTAADFRKLTPLVLGQALERARTVVCEPMVRARLEVPAEAIGATLALLARLGGSEQPPAVEGDVAVVETVFPVARTNELHRELPRLTRGEGLVETEFAGYRPVSTEPPARPRS